ncbi:hypothetical protein BH23ACT10_BH23ACT10_11410 [soil metagenome]
MSSVGLRCAAVATGARLLAYPLWTWHWASPDHPALAEWAYNPCRPVGACPAGQERGAGALPIADAAIRCARRRRRRPAVADAGTPSSGMRGPADVRPTAVRRDRSRDACPMRTSRVGSPHVHVRVEVMTVPDTWPEGRFDHHVLRATTASRGSGNAGDCAERDRRHPEVRTVHGRRAVSVLPLPIPVERRITRSGDAFDSVVVEPDQLELGEPLEPSQHRPHPPLRVEQCCVTHDRVDVLQRR